MLRKAQITIIMLTFTVLASQLLHAKIMTGSIITDPAVSRKCNALMVKRYQKIDHKQKISALIIRNLRLAENTPKNKKTILTKLEVNLKRLQGELLLVKSKIQSLEEGIIRKGCPGISYFTK